MITLLACNVASTVQEAYGTGYALNVASTDMSTKLQVLYMVNWSFEKVQDNCLLANPSYHYRTNRLLSYVLVNLLLVLPSLRIEINTMPFSFKMC